MATFFQKELSKNDFIFTFELVPGQSVRTRHYQEILRFLEDSQKKNLFKFFSITDNAGGNPALSPISLGKTIKNFGFEPIIHFSCKDKNRNQLESDLLALDKEGLRNLLVLTGDYPLYGYLGRAKPVYDLDSVLLLKMITDFEKGLDKMPPIPFFKGAVVNPFKLTFSELWLQYIKLYKKLKAGAYFIITQVGFYPKKWLELKTLLNSGITKILANFFEDETIHSKEDDERFGKIPLIGSILFLTPGLLKAIKRGKISGIIPTEKLLNLLENTDNFEKTMLELCAKFTAILKGLGFKGVHLCGFPLKYEKIELYFEKVEKYQNHWEKFLDEFDKKAVFEINSKTFKKNIVCFLETNFNSPLQKKRSLFYYFNQLAHNLFFQPESRFFPFLEKLAYFIEKRPFLKKLFTSFEYFMKKLLFNCQECGDCTLWEFNYHCPQSGCAKSLLNGPCGGSIDGFCEVYPYVKKCYFIKAFESAPSKKVLKKLLLPGKNFYIPPRNWELYKTSSWLNFYLKRDHQAIK